MDPLLGVGQVGFVGDSVKLKAGRLIKFQPVLLALLIEKVALKLAPPVVWISVKFKNLESTTPLVFDSVASLPDTDASMMR